MPEKDIKIQNAIEEIIGNSRKGRMKVIHLVQQKNPEMSAFKIRRIYEREGFSLFKRLKKRVVSNPSNPIAIPAKVNDEWAIDFMSDALTNDKKIRTLNAIDHYSRLCIGISVRHNFPAFHVIEILEQWIEKYGKPKKIRTDNGPEFISKKFQHWLHSKGIIWSCIPKGRPDQNAIIERFNRTFREDVLDANIFKSLAEAQNISDTWIIDYNHLRPHQSLNYKTPSNYAA